MIKGTYIVVSNKDHEDYERFGTIIGYQPNKNYIVEFDNGDLRKLNEADITIAKQEFYLGQYVKTKTHSHRGRIFNKDHDFRDESDEWFDMQKPKKDPETKNEAWYSILTKDGGSVYVNESEIIEIEEPYDLNNAWESYYFLPF